MPLHVLVASAAVAASFVGLVWSVGSSRGSASQAVARNLGAGRPTITDQRQLDLQKSAIERALWPAIRALAGRVKRLTPLGWLEALQRRIVLAGLEGTWPLERVLAGKLMLAGFGLAVGFLLTRSRPGPVAWFFMIVLALLAYVLPDVLLSARAKERQQAIGSALPDTLDQVTISVEAGLGFEAALNRAAQAGDGPLSEEFMRTLQEIKLGKSRAEAFRALAERTDVSELRRFVFAINQAENYGMPIATVLRVQADELRVKRRQRAEERALKMPVKLIFPLLLCIFPALFIVLIGPAAIQLARAIFGIDI